MKLSEYSKGKVQGLLSEAVRTTGSFAIEECLPYFEERLTGPETEACTSFLNWLNKNDRAFGHNLPEVWEEWEKSS